MMVSAKVHQKALDKRDSLIDDLTTALDNACGRIEENMKKPLLDSISPRTNISWQELSAKTPAELLIMKDVLDSSTPTFRSGTPINQGKTQSQDSLLASTFSRAQAARVARQKKLKDG